MEYKEFLENKKHTNLEPFIDGLLDEVAKLITNILNK